jgi:type I restriction enzyme S subunit
MWQTTTVQATLNLRDVLHLPIIMPPKSEREAIAEIIGALDDKMAVNDRIAATSDRLTSAMLEEILSDDAKVSDVVLADVAAVNQRKVAPASDGHLRYIDISSVSVGNIEWPVRIPWGDAPGRARRAVSPGDTIWSTVRPGRKSYALVLDEDPELVASTGFAVLTPVKVGSAFLYEVTKRDEFVQYLESVAEGSAYPAVRAERFERAIIPLPSSSSLESFECAAMPLRRRVYAAQTESRSLAQLRDVLLPRLMSGELRIRDAEKVVGEVS